MTKFEFHCVLIAIIVGLTLTQLLRCVSTLINQRRVVRVYWVHIVWIVAAFLLQAQMWYALHTWQGAPEVFATFPRFLANLALPVAMYVASSELAPVVPEGKPFDFRAYYYENHRGIFTVWAIAITIILLRTVLLLGHPFWSAGNAIRLTAIGVLAAIAVSGKVWLHTAAAILVSLLLAAYVVLMGLGMA